MQVSATTSHVSRTDASAEGKFTHPSLRQRAPLCLAPSSPRNFVPPLTVNVNCSSHGFCVGHIVPEAQVGGPIALVHDGDIISVDAVKNTIELHVPPEELERRRAAWKAPPLKVSQGTLYKYVKLVEDASRGCITDA